MKCSEIRSDLSLYADAILAERESVSVKDHLVTCPLCRERYAEIREVKTALRQMSRPELSVALQNQLKRSVRTEIRNTKTAWLPVSVGMRAWLYAQVMPYGVGTFASLLLGFTFLAMMFSGNRNLGPLTAGTQSPSHQDSIMLASNRDPFSSQYPDSLSASAYAQTRLDVSSESPSVNPRGALIALTKSLVRGGMKDDEVVVVADVFGNGLAQIAEVVEPSHNRQAVDELQRALDSDPAFAPFVSSHLDKRSDSMRVIFKLQSVNVSTGLGKHSR